MRRGILRPRDAYDCEEAGVSGAFRLFRSSDFLSVEFGLWFADEERGVVR